MATVWRFATEGEELKAQLAPSPALPCPEAYYGMPTTELTVAVTLCTAALAAARAEVLSWRAWVEIERAAQERLGHGVEIHN